jgi:hypothetical protein
MDINMTIPNFDADGFLPLGDYAVTFEELKKSILVTGSNIYPHWDTEWRLTLVNNLEILVKQLWQVGVYEIFADGSFAEDKDRPNDIDGYFVCDRMQLATGELQASLNLIDPHKVWTWDPKSRRPYGYDKPQLPMWHRYRVELYPHYGQSSGLKDEFGNALEFPAAFRKSRRGHKPRGIIKIRKET